jgi:predicted Fe-S protein YdhL (DUF1289 family)
MSFRKKYKLLLKSAKERNLFVDLNLSHFKDILELGCMYCGEDLSSQNGYCLDRIDNSLGYTDDNVTPCCKVCNMAKGTRTVEEFVEWISKASKFQSNQLQNIQDLSNKDYRKMENEYFNKSKIKNSEVLKYQNDN